MCSCGHTNYKDFCFINTASYFTLNTNYFKAVVYNSPSMGLMVVVCTQLILVVPEV